MPDTSATSGSAEIIAFPGAFKAQPEEPVLPDVSPHDRLRRALEMLEAAQLEQRQALATWRDAIAALSASASGLNRSLETYQESLSRLQER